MNFMKESNKLLADYLENSVTWNDLHDKWMFYEYDGKPILWQPDSDWNQLMKVIEKLHLEYYKKTDFMYEIAEVLAIPIGNSITWIYTKVFSTVKLLMNESPINPE